MPVHSLPKIESGKCTDCAHAKWDPDAKWLSCGKIPDIRHEAPNVDMPILKWVGAVEWDLEGFPVKTPGCCPEWQDAGGEE